MSRDYAAAAWLDELKGLARHQSTRAVREMREHIMHVMPLSSGPRITDRTVGELPGSALASGPRAWSLEEIRRTMAKAHEVLERAVVIVREAIHNQRSPITGRPAIALPCTRAAGWALPRASEHPVPGSDR
jgi:hypothetical protein